jgi:hypothetical protein
MVAVSAQLQKQYDTAQDRQDYANQYLSNLTTPFQQDQQALQGLRDKFSTKLSTLAKRPDLENAVRESTMLAQQLPQEYAPFAQSAKDLVDRKEELKKATEKNPTDAGYLTPASADQILQRDIHQYRGVQIDPQTGKYTGRFQGRDYTKDIDLSKKVDTWLEHAKPVVNGRQVEYLNGQWIDSASRKTTTMPADRVQAIINEGLSNDPEAQSWLHQQRDLGTYNINYSRLNPDEVVGMKAGDQGKDSVPVTLSEALHSRLAQGEDLTTAIKSIKGDKIVSQLLSNAHAYGRDKYTQHDVETGQGIQANPFTLKDMDNQSIPIQSTIIQPLNGSQYSNPASIESGIAIHDKANKDAYTALLDWQNTTKAKPNGNIYDPGTKWFDASGKEVTSMAQKFIDTQKQASKSSQELSDLKERLQKQAGYKIDPSLKEKADKAYQEYYQDAINDPKNLLSREDAAKRGQSAYDAVVQDTPGYARYKQLLNDNTKNTSAVIGLTTFKNTKLNTAINDNFNNLSVNLDSKGLKYGAQGLTWASGDKSGAPLAADDYKKIAGASKFAGIGIDTDGQYKMFFKVGTGKTDAKGNTVGEDVLVKMPAYSGAAQNLIKEGQITPARQFLTQSISAVNNAPGGVLDLPVGDNLSVKIRRITPSDKSTFNAHDGAEYTITYPGKNGTSKEVAASSVDELANSIIETFQNHK